MTSKSDTPDREGSSASRSNEAKPVGWLYRNKTTGAIAFFFEKRTDGQYRYGPYECQPLYAAPRSERGRNEVLDEVIALIERMYEGTDHLIEPTRIRMAIRSMKRPAERNES